MKVVGIDPGSLFLGWGYIEVDSRGNIGETAYGVIAAKPKQSFYQRLHLISQELKLVLEQYRPDAAVIEKIFLGKNVDSAFKLGHVRGVCAVECHNLSIEVVEYAARTVKKQITGSGNSDKLIVQNFLAQHLRLSFQGVQMDASDALALAFCHVIQAQQSQRLNRMEVR